MDAGMEEGLWEMGDAQIPRPRLAQEQQARREGQSLPSRCEFSSLIVNTDECFLFHRCLLPSVCGDAKSFI